MSDYTPDPLEDDREPDPADLARLVEDAIRRRDQPRRVDTPEEVRAWFAARDAERESNED